MGKKCEALPIVHKFLILVRVSFSSQLIVYHNIMYMTDFSGSFYDNLHACINDVNSLHQRMTNASVPVIDSWILFAYIIQMSDGTEVDIVNC